MKKIILALFVAAGFSYGAAMMVDDEVNVKQNSVNKAVDANGREVTFDKNKKSVDQNSSTVKKDNTKNK